MLEKGRDGDFLREMIGFAAQRPMELEMRELTVPDMASARPTG